MASVKELFAAKREREMKELVKAEATVSTVTAQRNMILALNIHGLFIVALTIDQSHCACV